MPFFGKGGVTETIARVDLGSDYWVEVGLLSGKDWNRCQRILNDGRVRRTDKKGEQVAETSLNWVDYRDAYISRRSGLGTSTTTRRRLPCRRGPRPADAREVPEPDLSRGSETQRDSDPGATGGIGKAAYHFFKGRGGNVEDLPLIDFYLLARQMRWTWRDWEETPQQVRDLCLLYLNLQNQASAPDE